MPGSGDKEEKRHVFQPHHTILVWRLLDACLTVALQMLYARKYMPDKVLDITRPTQGYQFHCLGHVSLFLDVIGCLSD
jgi:hypothetical protein